MAFVVFYLSTQDYKPFMLFFRKLAIMIFCCWWMKQFPNGPAKIQVVEEKSRAPDVLVNFKQIDKSGYKLE